MALNVALPLSGLLPELLYARCALLSPQPQDFEENLELLVTPYGSNESGIGSSSENKNPKSTSDEDETSSTSSASSTSSTSPIPQENSKPTSPVSVDEILNEKIEYQGRDILDLAKNLKDSSWKFQYAQLPDKNMAMFMANRSQYHRLGANGLNREYDLASCQKCTFQFPVNSPNIIFNDVGAKNANAKPIMRSNEKAQNNMPSFKMYKHF